MAKIPSIYKEKAKGVRSLMGEQEFILICKRFIQDYYFTLDSKVDINDIYVVWNCKILQNNKAMLSTTIPDGRYFEITYNGDKDEWYLDAYKKEVNKVIKL